MSGDITQALTPGMDTPFVATGAGAFLGQIQDLENEQARIERQLLEERATNLLARESLASKELTYRTLNREHLLCELEIMELREKHSQLTLEAGSVEKEVREQEAYIQNMARRVAEISAMNSRAGHKIESHLLRVQNYHKRLSLVSTLAPVTRDLEKVKEDLCKLRLENQKMRAAASRLDLRLLEEVRENETEKAALLDEIALSKARLSALQSSFSQTATAESQRISQLKTAIEVQRATNAAVETEIQISEQKIFAGASGFSVSDWPEL